LPFELREPGFGCKLEVLPVDELRTHEEIVPELLAKLVNDMGSSSFKDPIIADAKTRVVLDGMHRVAASRELGLRYLPVCSVDYNDPKIKIGCWYRVARGTGLKFEEITKLFRLILVLLGLDTRPSSFDEAKLALEGRSATAALLTAKECYLISAKSTGIHESYSWINRVERVLREEGFGVGYELEEDAVKTVDQDTVVMMVPCVRKNEVTEAALSGRVFAHKTTRHILPARPVGLDVPIEWLRGSMDIKELDRMFVEHLTKRKINHLPKGSTFGGRKYDEELLVFG
jgi:hypothetical protein